MKRIVIIGAGGHAHVIADIVRAEGNQVVAFLDDNIKQPDCSGPISDYEKYLDSEFIIGIGSSEIRKRLSNLNVQWHTAIHPSTIISDSVEIGEGTVVMPAVVINSRSKIGKHCIINSGAIVEHDNQIGDYCHVSVGANLGGMVIVKNGVWIGIGATIKNNVSITENVLIGAGATVVTNITERGTYIGIPAKKARNV